MSLPPWLAVQRRSEPQLPTFQAAEGDADDIAVVPQQSGLSPIKEEQTVPEQQPLQRPRFPPQPSPGGSTTSSPTHRPSAPTFAATAAPSHVALKALFFFMHEMAQAARGWGQALTPAADLAQVLLMHDHLATYGQQPCLGVPAGPVA